MPQASEINNTAVQLELKSWAVAQRELLNAQCAKNLQHVKPQALPIAEASTLGAAGTARSHLSATAVWGQPSLLPVAHKLAQASPWDHPVQL